MIYCHTGGAVSKLKIAITVDGKLLAELDRLIGARVFTNRSQALETALAEKLQRLQRTRLAVESAKLDPGEEKQLAEESYSALDEWPEY